MKSNQHDDNDELIENIVAPNVEEVDSKEVEERFFKDDEYDFRELKPDIDKIYNSESEKHKDKEHVSSDGTLNLSLIYVPNKKQKKFHESAATYSLYGGAKGGGKTCALIHDVSFYAMKYNGANCYIFRETFDMLDRNVIQDFLRFIPETIKLPNNEEFELYDYNKTNHEVTFFNGSKIYFRYLKNLKDAQSYRGSSMDYIGMDELTLYTEDMVKEIESCLRSAKGFPVRFRATSNPGGRGHHFVKKMFILGTNYGKNKVSHPITEKTLEFIPATVFDNEVLMNNDPTYFKRLKAMPYELREAYLYGNWDIFEGQAFPMFDENIHVCDPFDIPDHWVKWMSGDNGYNDPFAFYWYAVSEDGTLYVYREYTRNRQDTQVMYDAQAYNIYRLSHQKRMIDGCIKDHVEKINHIALGHDAWAVQSYTRSTNTPDGKSLVDYYTEGMGRYAQENGLKPELCPFVTATTDRRIGADIVRQYLQLEKTGALNADGIPIKKPKIVIFRTCKKLIEVLPLLISDEKDPEKVAEDSAIDHWFDSLRYGLLSRHVVASKPQIEKPRELFKSKEKKAKFNKINVRGINSW